MKFPYLLLTLEEHFLAQAARNFYTAHGTVHPDDNGPLTPQLVEIGDERLKSMNDSGVSLQVISHSPNSLALDPVTCVEINNELHDRISPYPDRFRGFATLPMKYPQNASKELYRSVQDLGFLGALIDSNTEGKFYDDPFYWSVFEAAVDLDVPVYLHPNLNEQTKPLLYDGNYSASVATSLSRYGWGWHSETAIHFLRLFAAGLFDHYPKLKLVLGHLGEMTPYQLDRIQGITDPQWPTTRKLREVWDENIWITSSGMFSLTPMATAVRQCKPDRILYSVDFPFSENQDGLDFMTALKASGLVSDEVVEGIAYKNAESLLKVTVNNTDYI